MAQSVTVKLNSWGFEDMKYLFKFIFSYPRSGVEAKRELAFSSATQHAMPLSDSFQISFQISAENGEWSVLTLGSHRLPSCVRDTA